MTQPAKDFWAQADRDLLDRWPKDGAGVPEKAARLYGYFLGRGLSPALAEKILWKNALEFFQANLP